MRSPLSAPRVHARTNGISHCTCGAPRETYYLRRGSCEDRPVVIGRSSHTCDQAARAPRTSSGPGESESCLGAEAKSAAISVELWPYTTLLPVAVPFLRAFPPKAANLVTPSMSVSGRIPSPRALSVSLIGLEFEMIPLCAPRNSSSSFDVCDASLPPNGAPCDAERVCAIPQRMRESACRRAQRSPPRRTQRRP
jgi:hypothetical protein